MTAAFQGKAIVITDPMASDVARAINLRRVPAALIVRDGTVSAQSAPSDTNSASSLLKFFGVSEERLDRAQRKEEQSSVGVVAMSHEGASHD